MMEVIEDLPPGVVGIKTHGKITHEDYDKILGPMLETAIESHGKVAFLYVIEEMAGVELEAMLDDTLLGIRHWNDFERIAVVTDIDWIRNATNMFGWMIPAEVKIFPLADIAQAHDWAESAASSKAA